MSKSTPGPWRVGGNSEFVNQVQIEPAIGCAYGAGYEVKANARLIASAPDLLEALHEVMSWIDDCEPDFTFENEWADTEIKARAAIKKATGD